MRGLGAAGRRRGRRGSPASEAEDELGVLVVGAPVSNGLHQTKQRATAVLGDNVGRRGGHGGRVNDGNGGDRVGRGEGKSGADLVGRERRRGREVSGGEWERGPRRRGELAPLSSPSPARGCGGDGPCSDPGRGNREGEGDPGRWARPAGPGVGPVGPGSRGGFSSFFCIVFCFLFIYFLFCFYLFINT